MRCSEKEEYRPDRVRGIKGRKQRGRPRMGRHYQGLGSKG